MADYSPGFLAIVEQARAKVRESTVQEVYKMLQSGVVFRLIDVREDGEWLESRIRGAEHISKGVLEREIELAVADPETPIVLYCGGGYRSVLAADALQQMGYKNVRSMAGGIRAWRAAGFPEEGA